MPKQRQGCKKKAQARGHQVEPKNTKGGGMEGVFE